MQNIVEFIKEEMSNRGMTYDLLAERVGTTRQNLWTKLNKNTRPNFETVRKILAALDYDLVVEKKKGAADPGEKEIADLKTDNDTTLKRVNTSINLNEIKEKAIAELGMVYAAPDQVAYYSIEDSDYMTQYEEIPG